MDSFIILTQAIIEVIIYLVPLFVPIFLLWVLWNRWKVYIRNQFIASQEHVLLQITLPKTIEKNPQAMELFLMSLYQTVGEANFIDKYIKGKTRPWFSLELVAIEGNAYFFIWTRKGFAGYLESQIYAQYPTVEINQVEDYVNKVDLASGKYDMWGCEFELTDPDPYPIKTYIDYGLDKVQDAENVVDPLNQTLEFFGTVPKGNQVWIQILVQAHKKEDPKPGTWFDKTDKWKDDAKDEIKKIKEEATNKDAEGKAGVMNLTDGQKEVIAALEKSIAKYPFNIGIRGVYIAEKDAFDPSNIGGLVGAFKQYNDARLNGFKPTNATSFTYPWQDITGVRLKWKKNIMFNAYVERGYFYEPTKRKHFVLNTEELATIYHFPTTTTETPSLKRVDSRKSEPPANLPV